MINFRNPLQREADIGGAHSGGLNIPGLISKDNHTINSDRMKLKQYQSSYPEKNRSAVLSQVEHQLKLQQQGSTSVNPYDWADYSKKVGDYMFPNDWQWEQPFKQQPIDPYKPLGPAQPSKNTYFDHDALMAQLEAVKALRKKPKSSFEELIDGLFTTAEKEQVLIDMGYELESDNLTSGGGLKITRRLADGTVKTITNTLDDLFLKEITVKFKNLLLAKASLKIKI
jgi:hypothetical protein